jgi:hypothetical protein
LRRTRRRRRPGRRSGARCRLRRHRLGSGRRLISGCWLGSQRHASLRTGRLCWTLRLRGSGPRRRGLRGTWRRRTRCGRILLRAGNRQARRLRQAAAALCCLFRTTDA